MKSKLFTASNLYEINAYIGHSWISRNRLNTLQAAIEYGQQLSRATWEVLGIFEPGGTVPGWIIVDGAVYSLNR